MVAMMQLLSADLGLQQVPVGGLVAEATGLWRRGAVVGPHSGLKSEGLTNMVAIIVVNNQQ